MIGWKPLLVGSLLALPVGCATVTGPGVTKAEIEEAKLDMQVKGLRRLEEQQQRVWRIGEQLIADWPPEHPREYPDTGLLVAKIDKVARKAFALPDDQQGIYALAVRPDGPAEAAGIRQGDIVVSIDGTPCLTNKAFTSAVKAMQPDHEVPVRVRRAAEELDLPVHVGTRQLKVSYWVHPSATVNAWTDSHNVVVTGGLLRFIESDDELAVILGHELAHVTEGHKGKRIATVAFATALGTALGTVTEIIVPGFGGSVLNVTSGLTEAAFSRDFEREADYRGLLRAFKAGYDVEAGVAIWERFGTEIPKSMAGGLMSTHPASPERMVRMRKVAQSLKTDGLDATIAKFEPKKP